PGGEPSGTARVGSGATEDPPADSAAVGTGGPRGFRRRSGPGVPSLLSPPDRLPDRQPADGEKSEFGRRGGGSAVSLGEIRLTPSQQQAVDSLDVDCIVSAGAGSGKTRVLVERFLHILDREGDEPDILERIVAITFTEKAATEMKNRIRDGMKRRLE